MNVHLQMKSGRDYSRLASAYRSALDELAVLPYEHPQEQRKTVKLVIDCLCEIPQKERPKAYRLAIGNLITGNIEKAVNLIEQGLQEVEHYQTAYLGY